MPWTRLRRLGPERQLAVDLGTANTVVYQPGKGVIAFEPSVVAVDERSGEVYAVGAEARRMIGRTPAHITATRPLRHGVIGDFEMAEQMLRYFIRSATRRIGAGAEVMVCVPSGLTQVERTAVEEATIAAGAARAYLIEEPLAAAIGAGLPVAESVGSLVLDVGGGTSEMAVTALGGMVVSHSVRIGGYDLDEAIVKLLQDAHRLLIGQEQAEAVKLEVGAARAGVLDATAEVAGRDLTTGLLRRTTVDAQAVAEALQRPLDQIIEGLELVLERTPPELAADIADRGLMLVGGGALLREFDALIRSRTGLAVTKSDDPLTTVALGAGLALENAETLAVAHAHRRGRRRRRA
ncbi:MAG TPA: rod shape-determining protein [Gaiellaceae bacterium]|nr:rod shape-determining protein [Gaiellaceae bacterium]